MCLYRKLVEGVRARVLPADSDAWPAGPGGGVVSACCRQLGWPIVGRPAINAACLHFADPLLGTRKLYVGVGHEATLVFFTAFSAIKIPAEQSPLAALRDLYRSRSDLLVSSHRPRRDKGNLVYGLHHVTLAEGLNHGMFRQSCETLVEAIQDFEAALRAPERLDSSFVDDSGP